MGRGAGRRPDTGRTPANASIERDSLPDRRWTVPYSDARATSAVGCSHRQHTHLTSCTAFFPRLRSADTAPHRAQASIGQAGALALPCSDGRVRVEALRLLSLKDISRKRQHPEHHQPGLLVHAELVKDFVDRMPWGLRSA